MWALTNRLARPSLARPAMLRALERNEQALRCLQEGEAEGLAGLDHLLEAGEACWRVFRPALSKPRWREVKEVIDLQSRLRPQLARPKARRQLQCALQRQSAWFGELTASPPAEAALLDGLARLYRKARRSSRRDSGGRRARCHVRRWLLAEELLLTASGHTAGDAGDRTAARFEALTEEEFAVSASSYRRALPWRVFLALATEPEPFGAGGGLVGAQTRPDGESGADEQRQRAQ